MVKLNFLEILTGLRLSKSTLLTITLSFILIISYVDSQNTALDCKKIDKACNDTEALLFAKEYFQVVADKSNHEIDEQYLLQLIKKFYRCIHTAMKKNYFETAIYMI